MFAATKMASVARSCCWWRSLSSLAYGRPIRGQVSLTGPPRQRYSSDAAQPPVGPVYELRIYSIKPDKFATFRQLMAEKFHIRLAYSLPLGYWIADLGGIFQAVHIWPYESVSQRAQIRQAMAGDEQWQGEFLSRFLPSTLRMDNALLVLSPGTALCTDFQPSPTAAYELLSLPLQPGGGDGGGEGGPSDVTPGETIVGSFRTVYGDVNTEFRLMRYADADTAFVQARKRAQENPRMAGYSRFMVPHECSPIK
ncbi:protein NipSnap homolog 3A-like [Babylonia areolata]|uniref:protein NipSnap homolog 3A-like n=1 Tax=Babylonia areolata TaxID=304850 RepID=UPI003FCF29CD